MPHRITNFLDLHLGIVFEAVILGVISVYKITEAVFVGLTDQDWSRLLGPHAFTVGLIFAVIVLWGNGVADRLSQRKRDAEAETNRDKRHEAQLTHQQKNADKLMDLQAESIKAGLKMSSSLDKLTGKLSARPCCMDAAFTKDTES